MKYLSTLLVVSIVVLLLPESLLGQHYSIKEKGAKVIFVDANGKKVFPEKYDDARLFHEGMAAVSLARKWGFINMEGQVIVPLQYDQVDRFFDGYAEVMRDGKWGYVNKNGEEVIETQYDYVTSFTKDLAIVANDKSYYIINHLGEHKSAAYDTISWGQDGYFTLRKDEKFGIANPSKDLLLEPAFEEIGAWHKGMLTVKRDGKWGNWRDGVENFEDPDLYIFIADEPPIWSKNCDHAPDRQKRAECSGMEMMRALYGEIRYPAVAREEGIEGLTVIQFVVDTNGQTRDYKVLRKLGGGIEEEAMRALQTALSEWHEPAVHEGIPVNCVFNMPVRFRLE